MSLLALNKTPYYQCTASGPYNYFEASAISKLDYFNFSERKGDTDPAVFFGGSGVYSVIFSSIDYMAGECQS